MHRFIIQQFTGRRRIGKSLALSLLAVAGILFTSLVATTEKADAQFLFNQFRPSQPILTYSPGTPIPQSSVLGLLTSGGGRWFEFRPEFPNCQIYDFKPSGVAGNLRTLRQTFQFNTLFNANQCRFSLGPITGLGVTTTSPVANNAIQVVYPSSPTSTERVVIVGSLLRVNNETQQIAVWRGDRDNQGRPIFRVWHRSFR